MTVLETNTPDPARTAILWKAADPLRNLTPCGHELSASVISKESPESR